MRAELPFKKLQLLNEGRLVDVQGVRHLIMTFHSLERAR